jgi:hypothetical protein
VTRDKHLQQDARRTSISLTPAEELALDVIQKRKRAKHQGRDTPSEIVAEALWRFLEEVEGIKREQIESLLPAVRQRQQEPSNVTEFRK